MSNDPINLEDLDEDQLDAYRQGIADERRRLINALEFGCGDNSCMIHKPHGMATNGGCQCIKTMPFQTRRDFLHALDTVRIAALTGSRAALDAALAGESAALERVAELERGVAAIRKAYDEGDESEVAIAALEMIGEA